MTTCHPSDPSYEGRVRTSFAKQGRLLTLSPSLVEVAPGRVDIALTPGSAVSQQHGFVHAGALATITDSATGYAALSLMPPGAGAHTTEFKVNLLAPAAGSASSREGVS